MAVRPRVPSWLKPNGEAVGPCDLALSTSARPIPSTQMDQDQPPKAKRRFRFSLRTLMIVVLGYAGLWTLTAIWGGWQLEQHVAEHAGQSRRVDLAQSGFETTQHPDGEYWAVETKAYAPFLLNVKYVVNRDLPRFVEFTSDGRRERVSDPRVLKAFSRDEQVCLIFWFFGKTWKYPPWHRSIGPPDPIFGLD
jgi:hypothetical protein